jgi:glycosyltransferase involved in cell wall biosynthesis
VPRTLEFVLPGDPETRTGGYEYDRRIVRGLNALGWDVRVHALSATFPMPDRAANEHAGARFAGLPEGSLVVVDGLAFGALPEVARREQRRLRLVALVHHPLALESGLDDPLRERLFDDERASLACARGVVVTSERTARDLVRYDVPRTRIAVVEPGTEAAPLAKGSGPGAGAKLLCVATLTPRKGHDVLLRALAPLRAHAWQLECVGSGERSPETARQLREQAARLGLADRVRWRGELDAAELAREFDTADVFVLAARHEGFGMAAAEALARGLPVVATRVGAMPELVGDEAGILVPPDDVGALRAALTTVLTDAGARSRFAGGAARVRERLQTWDHACARFSDALESFDAADGAEPADAVDAAHAADGVRSLDPRDPLDPSSTRGAHDVERAARGSASASAGKTP